MPGQYRDLADLLDVLRDKGCIRAKVEMEGVFVKALDVEFAAAPAPVPVSPFVDKDGKPVDMDEGAGELTKDPDDVASDAALEAANFRPKKAT